MKSDEKLMQIVLEIYRRMYKEARPSANFDKLMKSRKTKKSNWFMKYFLPIERQEAIINELCAKNKCNKHDIHKISKEVHLGCSPNSSK